MGTVNPKVLVTVKAAHENLVCTATQRYSEMFDNGHYQYVIFDLDGNIVNVNSSIAGAPKGKITSESAKEFIMNFLRFS